MKKIVVDPEKCFRCGACVNSAEEYFSFDENGVSYPLKKTVEEPSEELIEAVECCPAGAITLEDVEAPEEKAA